MKNFCFAPSGFQLAHLGYNNKGGQKPRVITEVKPNCSHYYFWLPGFDARPDCFHGGRLPSLSPRAGALEANDGAIL